jgi:hypothetical protein
MLLLKTWFTVVLSLVFLLWNGDSKAADHSSADYHTNADAWQFQREADVLAQLPKLEQQAATEHKLLLVVLGATWCHDSIKLLEHFNQSTMAQALKQRFAMAFVDVAYLEFGQAVTTRYQLPLYYGTPMVLIIDPKTRQLLNKTDLMHWTNAAAFDGAAYRQYFLQTDFVAQFATQQQALAGIKPQHLVQINQFEQQQAAQLMRAYQQLGPLLKAYKTSGQPASPEFKTRWDKIKAFRSNILPEVHKLQQQAITLAPGDMLALPESVAGDEQTDMNAG